MSSYDRGHLNDHDNHAGWGQDMYTDEDDEGAPFVPEPGDQAGGGGAYYGKFREYTLAIRLRHSPLYFGFNIFVLALTTFLVAWVVFSEDHIPRGRLFFFIEVIVTVAVCLDLAVEVSYYGGEAYFTGRGTNPTGRGKEEYSVVRCLSHWFQLVVTALCVIALLLYFFVPQKSGHAAIAAANKMSNPNGWHVADKAGSRFGPADEDNFVSLFLLLVRYLVYVVFIITSSSRTMQLQGCCDREKEWEVDLNDDADVRDSWVSEE
jgi:hypothetical protein